MAINSINRSLLSFVRTFSRSSVHLAKIRAGDPLPNSIVYEEDQSISIRDVFAGKRGILFSVPGAFTPGCSQAHIPEYIVNYDKFKEEGMDVIACVSVNDPFVMKAWQNSLKAEGKIRMLADMKCEFTKAMDMELDCTPLLGNFRSKRYSLIIEDGLVRHMYLEPDDTGLACLLCLQKMKPGYQTNINLEERHTAHTKHNQT